MPGRSPSGRFPRVCLGSEDGRRKGLIHEAPPGQVPEKRSYRIGFLLSQLFFSAALRLREQTLELLSQAAPFARVLFHMSPFVRLVPDA